MASGDGTRSTVVTEVRDGEVVLRCAECGAACAVEPDQPAGRVLSAFFALHPPGQDHPGGCPAGTNGR